MLQPWCQASHTNKRPKAFPPTRKELQGQVANFLKVPDSVYREQYRGFSVSEANSKFTSRNYVCVTIREQPILARKFVVEKSQANSWHNGT